MQEDDYGYVEDYEHTFYISGYTTLETRVDPTYAVDESNENDNIYSRQVGPFTSFPNLIADYTPSGWDGPIVASSVSGTHTDGPNLQGGATTYIDFAFVNRDADIPSSTRFYAYLYDGTTYLQGWYWDGMQEDDYGYVEDYEHTFTVGDHTLKTKVDPTHVVSESNEYDNEYEHQFSWAEVGVPDIYVIPSSLTINQHLLNPQKSSPIIPPNPQIDFTQPHIEDELIIKFKAQDYINFTVIDGIVQTGITYVDNVFRQFEIDYARSIYKGRNLPSYLKNTYLVHFNSYYDLYTIVQTLQNLPNVEWVDLNYIYETYDIPNDPYYSQQWNLHKVNAAEAWDLGTGSSNIPIAIVDTGVDWDHPDLSENIWINLDEIPNNGVDDDNNGYIDDIRGWDWVTGITNIWPGEDGQTPDNDPMDFHGHGTHCSGIASAVTNNGIGVAGMALGCPIMALRAGWKGSDGGGWVGFAFAASAIEYAVDNGAKVINMSFGGGSALLTPVTYAYNNNLVVTHAAGNVNSSSSSAVDGIIQTISVAATDQNDYKASFSNYGTWIDVSAPGVSIKSTYFNNTYTNLSGTSMSAPLVSGLAGLLISQDPSLTVDQTTNIILSTADNIDAQNPSYVGQLGTGRINAFNAMLQVGDGFLIQNIGDATLTITSITDNQNWLSTSGYMSIPFDITALNDQIVNVNVDWQLVGSSTQTGVITINSNDPDEPVVDVQVTAEPDVTPPPAPISLSASPSNWTMTNLFSIDWINPLDPTGIAAAWYKLGTEPTSSTDGQTTPYHPFTISSTDQGGQVIYVWLEDGAGNKDHNNRETSTLYWDATPPTGIITINDGDITTPDLIVTLNLNATDNMSGVDLMRFSNNSDWSVWEEYATTKENWDLSSYGGNINFGTKTVYVQYKDAVGNPSISFSDDIFYAPPPENVTICIDQNSVYLNWNEVNGATIYHIYRSQNPYEDFIEIGTSDTNSYIDILPAKNGNSYFYYMTAE